MADNRRVFYPWWMVPVAGTLLLLAFNSPWVRQRLPDAYQAKQWVFGLHLEMNVAVWWSAVLFFLSAALFYEAGCHQKRGRRRPYFELSLLLLALVIDEVGSLHERISGFGGWPSLAPFGLVMLVLLVDGCRLLWRDRETRPVAWLSFVGFVVLGSVAVQEYAEHNLTSQQWSEWYGRFIEEATELTGALLILCAAVYSRRGRWGGPTAAVVPDPTRMSRALVIIGIGFVAHLAAAQSLYLPKVGPLRWYGSPAAIYPLLVFFLLACYAYWLPRHRPAEAARSPEIRGFWGFVGLFFLFCSIGFMQNLWGLFGKLIPGLARRHFYEPVPTWVILIGVVWFVALSLRRQLGSRGLVLLALPLAPLIQLNLEHQAAKHLAAGFFALLCTVALLRPVEPAAVEGVATDPAGSPDGPGCGIDSTGGKSLTGRTDGRSEGLYP